MEPERTTDSAPVDYDEVWRESYGDMQDLGPAHRHMRRICERMLSDATYDSALEVGCGAGQNLELITRERTLDRVAGVDVSREALSRAREAWPEVEFTELDVQSEGLDRSWDLVFCSLVLEHLPDDEAALRNMRRMAKRYLLVTTIAGDFDRYRRWEEQVGHVRNYARGELEAKLERAGFVPERVVYWGFPLYSPIGRMLQRDMRSEAEFGPLKRALAHLMYGLYFLNGTRRGDLLIVLARVDGGVDPG